MRRPARVAALVLVLALAACGGDDERTATSADTTTAPTTQAATTNETEAAPEPDAFVVGAVDDAARHHGPVLDQLAEAGFGALGITSYWDPGLTRPGAEELSILRDVAERAENSDLRVFIAVFHRGSSTTPLTPAARAEFASYVAAIVQDVPGLRDVIVGNEPNLNRFWLPQFGPNGENVAAGAYLALLAETYDAAKAAAPEVRIWGGALAPRGVDKPNTGRDTHSPTTFIRDLGTALRASGRTQPVLDGFAFHPYPESSEIPPDRTHPNSNALGFADHERLRLLLRESFGRDVPILYSEFGVETAIPPAKAALYEETEPGRPADEATQASYYQRALELAACQEGVAGLLLFHSHDEPLLTGFQSGVYYVDGSPKSSFDPVRKAILRARKGC